MKGFLVFLLIIINSVCLIAQKNIIDEVFSEYVFREEFKKPNSLFPTEQIGDKFAILLEKEGRYFLGTKESTYTPMINWENDLNDFEFKTSITLSPEEGVNLFSKEIGQNAGIIVQYNPDLQEGLIFQINNLKKFRVIYTKEGEQKRSLTREKDNDWVKSENLRKNSNNEITIKSKGNKFELYINGILEFKIDLSKKRIKPIAPGRFGFHLGPKTKIKIDYIYISTTEEYNGMNKMLNLSEDQAQKLLNEIEELKVTIKEKTNYEIEELKKVLKLVEDELKLVNQTNDSLRKNNEEFENIKLLIGDNKDFLYTLSSNLKSEIEKNTILKQEKKALMDSIEKLIQEQDKFRLEYLKTLDFIKKKETTDTIEK